ncbi:MAG: dephospho-CoA kinase [Candidatus Aminicenantaceae bacterium]
MLTVALTGGIATGKSVVAKTLENLGCYIHHADKIAHQLMEPENPAWKKIVNHFSREILNPDKTINRAKLGTIVFKREKDRKFLNKIIHPLVLQEKKKTIEKLKKEGRYKIFISEAALTIESGFTTFFDKIVVVFCNEEIQIKRLRERDNISRSEALKKMSAQMSSREKLNYADYTIDTSGSIQSTIEQTGRVFRILMSDYELKCGITCMKETKRKA